MGPPAKITWLCLLVLAAGHVTRGATLGSESVDSSNVMNRLESAELQVDDVIDAIDDVIEAREEEGKKETPSEEMVDEKLRLVEEDAEDLFDDIDDAIAKEEDGEYEDEEEDLSEDMREIRADAVVLLDNARDALADIRTNSNISFDRELASLESQAMHVLDSVTQAEEEVEEMKKKKKKKARKAKKEGKRKGKKKGKRKGKKKPKRTLLDEIIDVDPITAISSTNNTDNTSNSDVELEDMVADSPMWRDPFTSRDRDSTLTSNLGHINSRPVARSGHIPDYAPSYDNRRGHYDPTYVDSNTRPRNTHDPNPYRGTDRGEDPYLNREMRPVYYPRDRNRVQPNSLEPLRTRSNDMYFDTSGLEAFLSTCPDCMVMTEQQQCPLNNEVLEMKKWASELQELLSFGCVRPVDCPEPGKCCIDNQGPIETTIVQLTQMMKDMYNMLQRNCRNCPSNGNWSPWTTWSACDVTCGSGTRRRTRRCDNPAPKGSGRDCPGMDTDVEACPFLRDCCIDGNWGSWGRWQGCSVSCGRGSEVRLRQCDSPAPNSCGESCPGFANDRRTCNQRDCCVDGNWASWGSWSWCSASCGSGTRERTRTCSAPSPNNCGQQCPGRFRDIESCEGPQCIVCVDGNWASWSRWGECSASCGGGVRNRVRSCSNPPPSENCGEPCRGSSMDNEPCNRQQCCVDGNWAGWGRWSSCSATCGRGVSTRRRRCSNPRPNACGTPCPGRADETRRCGDDNECCVDGNWGSWNSWTSCSATCGGGMQSRMRRCDAPSPNFCGRRCPGSASDSRVCGTERDCCVDGNWGSWGRWQGCSVSCGRGFESRMRRCDSPAPNSCGESCPGFANDRRTCNQRDCCVDGNWGSWGRWQGCSVSCGRGSEVRLRQCDSPAPNSCGESCPGFANDRRTCNQRDCCVDGNWASWNRWTRCSATCGQGTRERSRDCSNPSPNNCGQQCPGRAREMEACDGPQCVVCVNGNWASWSRWGECSAPCGGGVRYRSRTCTNPRANECGETCRGDSRDQEPCNRQQCCVDGNWGSWVRWSSCSVTCGRGTRERRRSCDNPPANFCGERCPGREFDTDVCDTNIPCVTCIDGNWGSWVRWSSCSVTCGRGTRERRRSCDNPPANFCGERCPGREFDTDVCDTNIPCVTCMDGNWGSWSSWSACPVTCGDTFVRRSRNCDRPSPNSCGQPCPGDAVESKPQRCGPPPVDGNWSSWSQWGPCSVTCGQGQQSRDRTCSNPRANACGLDCPGLRVERRYCEERSCQICEKQWSQWESWSSCSATCGFGSRRRSRQCRVVTFGSNCDFADCPGRDFDEETCSWLRPCIETFWSSWGACSVTCRGEGVRERRMVVRTNAGDIDIDASRMEREPCRVFDPECPAQAQWGMWAEWCPCDCKKGRRSRRRECVTSTFLGRRSEVVDITLCRGKAREEEYCDIRPVCPECITTCTGKPDGEYPSCAGCRKYIKCEREQASLFQCTRRKTEWDAFVSNCVSPPSPSCALVVPITDCTDEVDGRYHSDRSCGDYVECTNGLASYRRCPGRMEFNQLNGECEAARSPTCIRETPGLTDVNINSVIIGGAFTTMVNDAPVDRYYDEENGLTAEERREAYEKERKEKEEILRKEKEEKLKKKEKEKKENDTIDKSKSSALNNPNCVADCKDIKPGKYSSCQDCNHYVICTKHNILRQKSCPTKHQWDDIKKRCRKHSKTCKLQPY